MRLSKFIQWSVSATFVALIYIHLQMQIYDFAYQRTAKENQIRILKEHNGDVLHKVLTLKSANHLGLKLLSKDSSMRFISKENIIQVASPSVQGKKSLVAQDKGTQRKNNLLASLFNGGAQAEAKEK